MSARAREVSELEYVTSEAIHCTIMGPDGETTYDLVVVEEQGYALVHPAGRSGWVEVSLGDMDLDDSNDFDDVVAAVLDAALVSAGGDR